MLAVVGPYRRDREGKAEEIQGSRMKDMCMVGFERVAIDTKYEIVMSVKRNMATSTRSSDGLHISDRSFNCESADLFLRSHPPTSPLLCMLIGCGVGNGNDLANGMSVSAPR